MDLRTKITSKQAKVAVIDPGCVGLPLIIEFVGAGIRVAGLDTDETKADSLKAGETYIHMPAGTMRGIFQKSEPITGFSKLADLEAIVICVPTPLNKNREPDMSYVFTTTDSAANHLRKGRPVSPESTTYPGTTGEA